MQSVTHPENNIHPIFDEFDRLYSELSVKKQEKKLIQPVYDIRFKPLIDLFKQYDWDGIIKYTDNHFKPLETVKTKRRKEIIVCFSGGKDSTATAIHYKLLGYKVYLYHLHGINKMYKDEHIAAENVAKKLGMDFIQEEITVTGWVQPDWIEHPMKNMIIANRAIQWAIRNKKSPFIAFGNFSSSTLESDPFDVCGGDCKELWDVYSQAMAAVIPSFRVQTPLINMQETLDTLFVNTYLINDIQSCIIPYHYKVRLRKRHAEKYTYKLPENRCGSCWKCAVEYIVYCDHDIWQYDEVWYKHCLEVLKNTLKREQSLYIHDLSEVWEHYFFYNINDSKYFSCKKIKSVI